MCPKRMLTRPDARAVGVFQPLAVPEVPQEHAYAGQRECC
jgi:hypothetical protein